LLTNDTGLFLQTRQGHVFDLLVDPTQALLGSDVMKLKPVKGQAARPARQTKAKTA
jgi:hypothetical protein